MMLAVMVLPVYDESLQPHGPLPVNFRERYYPSSSKAQCLYGRTVAHLAAFTRYVACHRLPVRTLHLHVVLGDPAVVGIADPDVVAPVKHVIARLRCKCSAE